VKDDIIEEVSRRLKDYDHWRFSRDSGTLNEMERSLQIAEELITKIERQLS